MRNKLYSRRRVESFLNDSSMLVKFSETIHVGTQYVAILQFVYIYLPRNINIMDYLLLMSMSSVNNELCLLQTRKCFRLGTACKLM